MSSLNLNSNPLLQPVGTVLNKVQKNKDWSLDGHDHRFVLLASVGMGTLLGMIPRYLFGISGAPWLFASHAVFTSLEIVEKHQVRELLSEKGSLLSQSSSPVEKNLGKEIESIVKIANAYQRCRVKTELLLAGTLLSIGLFSTDSENYIPYEAKAFITGVGIVATSAFALYQYIFVSPQLNAVSQKVSALLAKQTS